LQETEPRTARPDDRQAARQAPTKETLMEMSWMETFQLLGLDLLAVMLVVLVGLDLVQHAVHSAWETARERRPGASKTVAAPRVNMGGIRQV
jgi:hypothetical protein